jgi:hypothetical protein
MRFLHQLAVAVGAQRLLKRVTPLTSPGPICSMPSAPFTRSVEPWSVSRKFCKPMNGMDNRARVMVKIASGRWVLAQ